MSESKVEEIIAVLWLIAALLAFNGGYEVFGWALLAKAISDTICSLYCAYKEAIAERPPSKAK